MNIFVSTLFGVGLKHFLHIFCLVFILSMLKMLQQSQIILMFLNQENLQDCLNKTVGLGFLLLSVAIFFPQGISHQLN